MRLWPELAWVLAGAAALAVGVFIYALGRSRESVYFLGLVNPAWAPPGILPAWLDVLSDHAPSLVHVYAFSLFTAACLPRRPRRAALACAVWSTIDVLFECAQHPLVSPLFARAVPDGFAHIPFLENVAPHFRTSTFDPLDLVAIAIGGAAAYVTILWLAAPTEWTVYSAARVARHSCRLVLLFAVLGGGLLTILGTGGGGGDDSGASTTPGGGWVTIDQPTSAGQYSTDRTDVTLGGEAFISPTWFRCCTGSATDTGVTVGWENQATGASGAAGQTVRICWLFGFFLCDHRWTASVPLALGDNPITVTASDPSGNVGRASITVTREPDTTPPTVTATTPKDNAIGVGTNTAIIATFSEEMEAGSIDAATFFVVDNNAIQVGGAVSASGATATFTPSGSLLPSTRYTATVTTGVTDLAGNPLAAQKSWSFTTGINTWQSMATAGGPAARTDHTAVWTGQEVIVWGGNATLFSTTPLNSGSRYGPATDSWQAVSATSAPSPRLSHTAVWTGTEMIIWGGWDGSVYLNTGGRYNPATNSWQPMPTMNAPSGRGSHTAVWTGTEMIVWGGGDGSSVFTDGGRYDPLTDTWSPVTALDPALSRRSHTTVWTGNRMIVWGGWNGTTVVNTGAAYDPASDTWQLLGTSDAPPARVGHTAVWAGTEMIVWGGWDFTLPFPSYFSGGARYDPLTDRWQSLSATGAPTGRVGHRAVWTGSEMLVWGGTTGDPLSPTYLNTGGRYALGSDSWQPLSTASAPAARAGHTAAWTGTQMAVWGGSDGSAVLASGGRYTP